MKNRIALTGTVTIIAAIIIQTASAAFPCPKTTRNGVDGYNFKYDGRSCKVILPQKKP